MYPTTYLQPGSSDTQSVKKLQNYLVNKGYMTQDQVNTGYGIYGPRTKAGVTAMQNSLGVDNTGGVGYYGPKTLKALQGSKYALASTAPTKAPKYYVEPTPTTTQPVTPTTTVPTRTKQSTAWHLSPWTSTGTGQWKEQPVLTIGGQQFRFDTPQGYIDKLQGLPGLNDSKFISQLRTVIPEFQKSQNISTNQNYTSALKNALGSNTTNTNTDTINATDKTYIAKLQKQIATATTAMQNAGTKLATTKTDAYNKAYAAAGIDKIKAQISAIDTEIATDRQKRDDAIAKVTNNPQLSAALMTGRARKIADAENARINNKIRERNGLAGTYNTGLSEVQNKANNATTDAMDAYNAAREELSISTNQAKSYRAALIDALKQGATTSYRNKMVKIAMMNAQSAAERARKYGTSQSAATKWKLATSPLTGEALYWYNSAGATKPLSAQDRANLTPKSTTTATTTPVVTTAPSQHWYSNILGWFGGK